VLDPFSTGWVGKVEDSPHRNAVIHASNSSVLKHFIWKVALSVSMCMSFDLRAEDIAACDIDSSSLTGFPGPKE
jgi:hypothetical protein